MVCSQIVRRLANRIAFYAVMSTQIIQCCVSHIDRDRHCHGDLNAGTSFTDVGQMISPCESLLLFFYSPFGIAWHHGPFNVISFKSNGPSSLCDCHFAMARSMIQDMHLSFQTLRALHLEIERANAMMMRSGRRFSFAKR